MKKMSFLPVNQTASMGYNGDEVRDPSHTHLMLCLTSHAQSAENFIVVFL